MKIVLLETNTTAVVYADYFISASLGYVNSSGTHYTFEDSSYFDAYKEEEETFVLTSIYDVHITAKYLAALENDEWKI